MEPEDGNSFLICEGSVQNLTSEEVELSSSMGPLWGAVATVFIFDDSFSALDYKTDAAVRSALSSRTKDAAVIIVAQRISTILHAEQIIVLDDGKIAGIGTHRELLKNCEAYYQIASSQLSEEELERDMKEAV